MDGDGVLAGRVGRPHGLDGSFYVTRPRPGLLELGTEVRLDGRERRILRRAGTAQRPIVRVEGCEDRETAQALRGADLTVDAGRVPALPEGEWWAEDLAGCRVLDGERVVGVVGKMLALPSCECLDVERPDGSSLLVPMVRDAIRRIDVATGVIDVNLTFLGERA